MANYVRYQLCNSKMHTLGKSFLVSVCGKSSYCQLRNFLSCAKFYKRQEIENNKAYKEIKNDFHVERKETIVPQIDQSLMDALYEKEHEDLKKVSKDGFILEGRRDYFKQAWQNKLKYMTKNKLQNNEDYSSAKVHIDDKLENSFGTLQGLQDKIPKKMDYRDPNERIALEYVNDKDEERDWRKSIPLTRYGRLGRKAFYYTKKMTEFGKKGKVNEAIKVFDDWMMIQDRVLPSKRTFITLIGIVGRAGYTRKAFQLFREMKHIGLDPPDQVYTSLFNACANCPMSDYGLEHTNALYQQMQTKGILPSPITTMAAMKAFALCGDFPKAFQILDERTVPLDVQCFNSLLMACAVDKQSGFRRALKVWQRMRENRISPTHQTYNLLVRCVRDCGVGDVNTLAEDVGLISQGHGQEEGEVIPLAFFHSAKVDDTALLTSGQQQLCLTEKETLRSDSKYEGNIELLQEIKAGDISISKPPHSNLESLWPLNDDTMLKKDLGEENVIQGIMSDYHEKVTRDETSSTSHEKEWWEDFDSSLRSANWSGNDPLSFVFLEKDPILETNNQLIEINLNKNVNSDLTLSNSVALSDLDTKPGRLSVIGGMSTLVSHMQHHGIQPDIRTFTGLLSCVRNNAESEAVVLRIMEDVGVTPDIDFLNDIMMRRNMRHQSHSVKEVLVLVSKQRLSPNMRTYAAIALTCHNQRDALALVEDMRAANVEPSPEVMGHLIYISRLDFPYKRCLLEIMEDQGLRPNPRIISMIEKSIAICKRHIVNAEKMSDVADSRYLTPKFQKQFKQFIQFYQAWLKRTELHTEKHPWEKFSDSSSMKKDKNVQSA